MNTCKLTLAALTLASTSLTVGCSPQQDTTLERAIALLEEFQCPAQHRAQYIRLMAEDKRRAELFIQRYREGQHLFQISIDAVVENQLEMYRSSCNAAG
jgi:ribulose bisphosphate carboxylase small subunit